MANESVRAGTPSSPVPRYLSMPATSNMNAKASSGSSTPAVIAIVVLLGAALVMVSYYTMVARFCHGRLALPMLNRRMRRRNDDEEDQVQAGVMTWAVVEAEQVGVEEAIIRAIPVVEYRKFNWKEGTDCAVCLSQFEEEERVRLLPMCSHAFHLPCIDVWLRSHANCPLCRALISIQAHHPPSPTSEPSDNTAAAVADDDNHLIHITDEFNTRERAHTPPTPKLQSLDREQPIKAGNLTINDRQAHGQNVGATTSGGVSKEVYKRLQLAPNSSRCFSMGRLQGFHSHRLDDGDYSQHMQITMSSNEKTSPLKSMGMQRSSSHK